MILPSVDDIRELTYIIQRSNDMLIGAVKARDADAGQLDALRAELEQLQQSARSDSMTGTNAPKSTASSSARKIPSSLPGFVSGGGKGALATMNVSDLVRLGQVVVGADDGPDVPAAPSSLRSARKPPGDQRTQQQIEMAAALEAARARSFQARLHTLDRLRSSALESAQKISISLERNARATSTSATASSPAWGPRATAAFYGRDSGGSSVVSSDTVDDAIRLGVAAWLEWAGNHLSSETSPVVLDCGEESDDTSSESREKRKGTVSGSDEPNRICQLYRALLIAAEFSPLIEGSGGKSNNSRRMTSCANDLAFIRHLADTARLGVDNDGEGTEHQPCFQSLADRARTFFEASTQQNEFMFPRCKVGVAFDS